MSTEAEMYRLAYNAHEWAEQAGIDAIREKLEEASVDALMCLADPQWRWETRSSLSGVIIIEADAILTEKLDAMVST